MSEHTKGRLAYMHTLPSGTFEDTGWNVQFLRDPKEADSEMAIHGGTVTPLVADPVQELAAARALLREVSDLGLYIEPNGRMSNECEDLTSKIYDYLDACDTPEGAPNAG